MENNRQDLGSWVDDRLASLEGTDDWQPDSLRALARLRRRQRSQRVQRAGWIGATAAAMAAGLVLLTLAGPKACANPLGCANEATSGGSHASEFVANYKESGSP